MMDESQGFRLSEKTHQYLEEVDNMTPEMRALVHDFGSEIVGMYVNSNVKNPKTIRMLIINSWLGARSPINRSRVNHGVPTAIAAVDWLLIQAGAPITARNLINTLAAGGMVICPNNPTGAMVAASMNVELGTKPVGKNEKHARRLQAALNAVAKEWREGAT